MNNKADDEWQRDDWQIEGYLLEDPTIDRDVIEQQMLDDTDFALRVAAAAERLELIALAASASPVPAFPLVSSNSGGIVGSAPESANPVASKFSMWKLALAVAATIIIGMASTLAIRGHQRGFDEIANSWLAIEKEMLPIEYSPAEIAIHDAAFDTDIDLMALSNADSDEWLIDGAIAFFSEHDF